MNISLDEINATRVMLGRILYSLYLASGDSNFEEKATNIIKSVFYFILNHNNYLEIENKNREDVPNMKRNENETIEDEKIRATTSNTTFIIVRTVIDAVTDIFLHPINGFNSENYNKNKNNIHLNKKLNTPIELLKMWMDMIQSSTVPTSTSTSTSTPIISSSITTKTKQKFALRTNETNILMTRLISRILLAFSSNLWCERMTAIEMIFQFCRLKIPFTWIYPFRDSIVIGLLKSLEFPFSLIGLSGVKNSLSTLKLFIRVFYSSFDQLLSNVPAFVTSSSTTTSFSTSISKNGDDKNIECSSKNMISEVKYDNNENVKNVESISMKKMTAMSNGNENENKNNGIKNHFLKLIIFELFHPSPCVRTAAKCALLELSKSVLTGSRNEQDCTTSTLLLPVKDFINEIINDKIQYYLIDNDNDNSDDGFIVGLTFLLNLNNSNLIIRMTKDIIRILKKLLDNTESDILPVPLVPNPSCTYSKNPVDDDLLFELRVHPFKVDIFVLKRLLFLRYSYAVFHSMTQSIIISNFIMNQENKNVLQKCFILLFLCLSSPWEDLGSWSLKCLHQLIRMKSSNFISIDIYESIFPR